MKWIQLATRLAVLMFGFSLLAGAAQAQATRTWVSGVGDDANPCSRTAPCKTFAGAISKTAAGGEINVLDPGGFGAVTITKSITISSEGFEAGVLVSGTNGVVINAGASDVVVLRGLDFQGLGTGLVGVNFLNGGALHIEKCVIRGFRGGAATGVSFSNPGAAKLYISDTVISENGTGFSGGGVIVTPGAAVNTNIAIERTQIINNVIGFRSDGVANNGRINAAIRDSLIADNSNRGIWSLGANGRVALDTVTVTGNNFALESQGNGLITANNVTIAGNARGLTQITGGTIVSFGNNRLGGSSVSDGAFSSTIPLN